MGVGDSISFFKLMKRESAPNWRGPAVVLDIDGAGVTAYFEGKMFEVARYCVRKSADPKGVGEVEWIPASDRPNAMEVWP